MALGRTDGPAQAPLLRGPQPHEHSARDVLPDGVLTRRLVGRWARRGCRRGDRGGMLRRGGRRASGAGDQPQALPARRAQLRSRRVDRRGPASADARSPTAAAEPAIARLRRAPPPRAPRGRGGHRPAQERRRAAAAGRARRWRCTDRWLRAREPRDFASYDARVAAGRTDSGEFDFLVGASSRAIRLQETAVLELPDAVHVPFDRLTPSASGWPPRLRERGSIRRWPGSPCSPPRSSRR
jgi:hypothetical protein